MSFNNENVNYWCTSNNKSLKGIFYNGNTNGTTDTLSTITASAYFNNISNNLSIGDCAFLNGSDGQKIVTITAVSPNVTVSDYVENLSGGNIENVAVEQTEAGIYLLYKFEVAGGATVSNTITVDDKIVVEDVCVVTKAIGTASDTVQVLNDTNAITEAIDISGASINDVFRNTKLLHANATIAAAGTLKVTLTDGGGSDAPAVNVLVTCRKSA